MVRAFLAERAGVSELDEVKRMKQIIRYLEEKYHPLSIILYGSYANGTNDKTSDFDALVISADHERFHDTAVVDGVPLDVFVYPAAFFASDYSCEEFIQIIDGRILVDNNAVGCTLQAKVREYLRDLPCKTPAELQASVDWCMKMLERAKRNDCEGWFRWHWLLTDSLEIFCDINRHPYFGPKKALQWLEQAHSEAFTLYKNALSNFSIDDVEVWITYIRNTYEIKTGQERDKNDVHPTL